VGDGVGNTTLHLRIVAVLWISSTAWGRHPDLVQKVPFKLFRDHLIVVTGSLGRIQNCSLLIDTGASPTIVDAGIANRLGLKTTSRSLHAMNVVGGVIQTYNATLESLDIGPVRRDSMPVDVADLSLMKLESGLSIDAIVGLDALSPNSFVIDFEHHKIVFGEFRVPRSAVPMTLEGSLATVELIVNREVLKLIVDTGSSQLVLFQGDIPDSIRLVNQGSSKMANLAGEVQARQVQLEEMKLGKTDLGGLPAILTWSPGCCGFQGILGISAQQFKRIGFDFDRRMFAFEIREFPDTQVAGSSSCPGHMSPNRCVGLAFQQVSPPR
jgi:predicted aspartyl protease